MNEKNKKIVYGGIIACVYAVLTLTPGLNSFAYGPVQLRIAELLTILPLFTSSAIPGLTVGCIIANMASPMILDMVFGTAATLIASYFTYKLRKYKKIALLMPVIFNALIIGTELSFFYSENSFSIGIILYNIISVGIGELIICFFIGYPLSNILEKRNFLKK